MGVAQFQVELLELSFEVYIVLPSRKKLLADNSFESVGYWIKLQQSEVTS